MSTTTKTGIEGALIIEGKTKRIRDAGSGNVEVISKNDITAGDGAKHDTFESKAICANNTTCNTFRLLADSGIPVAFHEQINDERFLAPNCKMLPFEVVVRREAHGSYLKRNLSVPRQHVFPQLIVEFFLKTNDRKWKDHDLPCDDPFMVILGGENVELHDPKVPFNRDKPFLVLPYSEIVDYEKLKMIPEMKQIAAQTFLVLERAWDIVGGRLVDFKVEFGLDSQGRLLLADVIDHDSWRVVRDDSYIDKQQYRDGAELDEVVRLYHQVMELTSQFKIPRQQIILWRASDKDNLEPFREALGVFLGPTGSYVEETLSWHKEPVRSQLRMNELVRQCRDSVAIVFVGRSNGAGPTMAANTTIPVITVPNGWKDFPEDVWSSLRAASNGPVMTVLDPANAVLAACQILAQRNPFLYKILQSKLEERQINVAPVINP